MGLAALCRAAARRDDRDSDGEPTDEAAIGDLLRASEAQDLRDIKKLLMAWLGAQEVRRRPKKKGGADGNRG